MKIITTIQSDLSCRGVTPVVEAAQNDANTRAVELHLLDGGKEWPVPAGVTGAVAFRKSDGHKGLYDTLPDGSAAVTISGSTVTAILAPQVLTSAGDAAAAVVLCDKNLNRLATFPFTVSVSPDPSAGGALSNDYYKYATMEAVSEGVEAALAALEESKQDFLSKGEEALAAVHDAATEAAPAIACEVMGDVIHVADAGDRLLKGLTLYGKTTQSGAPSPDAPVALESAGARGEIGVSVTDGTEENVQTLTVSTPNGLPGIPVSSGGNYTDETGQQWVCDYKDFAKGVYVQILDSVVLDGAADEVWTLNDYGVFSCQTVAKNYNRRTKPLCSHYPTMVTTRSPEIPDKTLAMYNQSSGSVYNLWIHDSSYTTVEELTAALSANPVTVLYARKAPVETPLAAEELAAFASLHSNKPNTTVYNDGIAGMKLAYVADTKTYIDNRFTALRNAILSAGANI